MMREHQQPEKEKESHPLEEYAIVGDRQTAALISLAGSVDWLCFPRFDSEACFAALVGDESNGRWCIRPSSEHYEVERRYLPQTLILETVYRTEHGECTVLDFMPNRSEAPDIVRIVRGRRGSCRLRFQWNPRFGYGLRVPWVRDGKHGIEAIAGPHMLRLQSSVGLPTTHNIDVVFRIDEGEEHAFILSWYPSYEPEPDQVNPTLALKNTKNYWEHWLASANADSLERLPADVRALVERSLVTIKALTSAPTGGIVAAPTTSLPERFGGSRNWDYRFCWLRDATFSLLALLSVGYKNEAEEWLRW
ncbi:MAG: glycoside hydrolase family 15 protein, partial [Bdellovibrionales bacterium]|nr:glycoside hydrolase family 15 protein [Bdellovibrionales bacterium]